MKKNIKMYFTVFLNLKNHKGRERNIYHFLGGYFKHIQVF